MLEELSKIRRIGKFILLTLLCANPLWADDTEIFFSQNNDSIQPNVLFVLDASGSMNWYDCAATGWSWYPCHDGTANGSTTRFSRLKTALTDVLNNTSNVNVGLMRFSHVNSGGRITYPIRPIDQQMCNGIPCGANTEFEAKSSTSASEDDAIESQLGVVTTNELSLPLMKDDDNEQFAWVGMRFPDLQIPQGATITDARLILQSTADKTSSSQVVLHAQDTDNATPYTQSTNNISGRSRYYNSVTWDLDHWTEDGSYESPDIKSLIQHVVSKPGWCGGNALGLSMNGYGTRLAEAFDRGGANGPALVVSYKLENIPATGGCTKNTVLSKVLQGTDDAYERHWPSKSRHHRKVLRNSGYNPVALYTSGSARADQLGIRFKDVNVPQGAELIEASLTFVPRSSSDSQYNTTNATLDIYAQDSENASYIGSSRGNLTNRTMLADKVTWSNVANAHNVPISTPPITALAQTLVNKSDWDTGNAMFFKVKAVNGGRAFYSYNKSKGKSPTLKIVFKTYIRTAQDKIDGPVTDVRTEIIEELNSMVANHGTPTVGAMLEAKNYFSGGAVVYGKQRNFYGDGWGRYSRVSTGESYTGGQVHRSNGCYDTTLDSWNCADEYISGSPYYSSPITHECQPNHIVLLTDGEPNADSTAVTTVEGLSGASCEAQEDDLGTCGKEIAQYLNENDQSDTTTGNQLLTTHTIGFNFTTQWLKDVANAGGGNFYTADTSGQLASALSNIIDSAQSETATFVAPAATVDHFSRISHRSDIYLALFEPKSTPRWNGNLKRYDFSADDGILKDADKNPAVDPDTGTFDTDARSIWSATADGNNVAAGGAASRLPQQPGDRKVYTYTGASSLLTDSSNEFHPDNTAITAVELGLQSDDSAGRTNLINWAIGYDVLDEDSDTATDDARHFIGDPLHSKPTIITYGTLPDTANKPDSVIFFGTNEGFIHAIETETGDEVFSFMPQEMLPNIKPHFDNDVTYDSKLYGMDGALSLWKKDINNNGTVDGSDHVFLYAGMRRGGSSYYALNVTDKDAPEFKWQIDSGDDGFDELGQTWSQPVPVSIKYGTTVKRVLIFGGGYDNSQDDADTRTIDAIGRALYIVDADEGTLLWSGGGGDNTETKHFEDMVYSMPATPKTIDANGDGFVEQIYIGDMGGRIWRFDIDKTSDTLNLFGGIIADLATDGVMSDARRFYHTPDISLARVNGELLVNIAIGSGYQAHPLNKTIEDRFYLLRYPYAFRGEDAYGLAQESVSSDEESDTSDDEDTTTDNGPAEEDSITGDTDAVTESDDTDTTVPDVTVTYAPITESDLFDATDNLIGEGTGQQIKDARAALIDSPGWLIQMERSGEKILGPSVTFDRKIMFTSYIPDSSTETVGCAPQIGTGSFWAVYLWDATPVNDYDEDADMTKEDRHKPVPGSGLPPPPQTLILMGKSGPAGGSGDDDDDDDDSGGDGEGKSKTKIITISGANTLMEHDDESLIERIYWSEYPNF